jgi:hypothetical protein
MEQVRVAYSRHCIFTLLFTFAYAESSHGTVTLKITDLEILADLHVASPLDYGKAVLDMLAVCLSISRWM